MLPWPEIVNLPIENSSAFVSLLIARKILNIFE